MFGDGVIVQFEGQANSARVQVNFDDEGSKWLVLQYANLTPLWAHHHFLADKSFILPIYE